MKDKGLGLQLVGVAFVAGFVLAVLVILFGGRIKEFQIGPVHFEIPTGQPSATIGAPQSEAQPTPTMEPSLSSGALISCKGFEPGETRQVLPGTFVIGDIIIDGIAQYDSGTGASEGTVAYFEAEASVTAQWGAGCYRGSKEMLNEVVQGELQHGCGSSCTTIRVVIVDSDGQQEVEYYSKQ